MGQAHKGQPALASPPGALGPRHWWGQSVNSQARLWVLGALVHPWLLSRQDFPGLRCCLGNPGGRSHVSPTRKCPAECPHPQPRCRRVGPSPPQGLGLPGSPSSGGPGRVLRAQGWPRCRCITAPPPSVLVHAVGMWLGVGEGEQRPAGGTCLAPFGPVVSWGSSASRTASISLGKFGEISLPSLRRWQQAGASCKGLGPRGCMGSSSDPGPSTGLPSWEGLSSCSSRGLGSQQGGRGTAAAPESLAEGPREALEDGGFMAGAPWAPQSCLTGHTVLSWPHTGIFGQGTRSPWEGAPQHP